jgi:molybdopterin-guanine dinucleotide biosynthesis protein A
MTSLLNGLILCGGKSSRMGKDKSLISYHGKPQRDYLLDLLKPHCDGVFVSAQRGSKASDSTIPDHFDLDSPLNGILSAFHFDPDSAWLTVPVDMPNINSNAIKFLLHNRDQHKAATCFFNSDGDAPEPLLTIWEVKARPQLFDFFNHGERSPKKFLQEHDVHVVKVPSPTILVNVNTEEDLAKYLGQSGKTMQGY